MGLAPVVATASFPLINLPKFYLSFTILVLLILVKYPDRVGLVNAMNHIMTVVLRYGHVPTVYGHVRSLFTSTKLRVFNPAAFGSQGAWD